MIPLQQLTTALIRIIGLFYAIHALDAAFGSLFSLVPVMAYIPKDDPDFSYYWNPWLFFLFTLVFYPGIAIAIFVLAPRLARLFLRSGRADDGRGGASSEEEGKTDTAVISVPWHETLIFCTGALIASWALVRLTDTAFSLIRSAQQNEGKLAIDNAMSIYILLTVFLLGAGILFIAKFHRISAWMVRRREAAVLPRGGKETGAEQNQ